MDPSAIARELLKEAQWDVGDSLPLQSSSLPKGCAAIWRASFLARPASFLSIELLLQERASEKSDLRISLARGRGPLDLPMADCRSYAGPSCLGHVSPRSWPQLQCWVQNPFSCFSGAFGLFATEPFTKRSLHQEMLSPVTRSLAAQPQALTLRPNPQCHGVRP